MRSDSRFEADTIMSKTIDTETVNLALEGKAGTTEIMDYRNKLVISSYDEVDVLGTHWAIIAEIDDAEVAAGAVRLRNNAMIIFGVSALIIAAVAAMFAGKIANPIIALTGGAQQLAKGNVNVNVDIQSKDELGDLGYAFKAMVDGIKEQVSVAEQVAAGNVNVSLKVRSDDDVLSVSINKIVSTIGKLIEQMNHMSEQHDLGDIDIMVNTNDFEGAYKEMAQGVNDMVNGHITVKKKAMACVKELGQGNFDAELERFPGKKAFINDTIEIVRENLKSVSVEIKQSRIISYRRKTERAY